MSDDTQPVNRPQSLWAKIAVDFPDDPKVIVAGYAAELAYIRCTLYSKDAMTDGVIHRARVGRWLSGIPGKASKHMDALVSAGLIETCEEGWRIPPEVWRRWNKTSEEIAEESAQKSKAGTKGNHVKHHVDKGVVRPDCRYCLADSSHGATKVLAESSQDSRKSSPETETETETYSPVVSHAVSSSAPPTIDDDGSIIASIVKRCAAIRTEAHRPSNPVAYQASIEADMLATEREAIHALLVQRPFLKTQPEKAATRYELARRDAQRAGA